MLINANYIHIMPILANRLQQTAYSKLIKYNMALDVKNTTFLRPTFSPKNRLNTFYRKMNTAWF